MLDVMKVVLLENVSGLGRADDIKEVADGYARNYLFPHHLAVPASGKIVSDIERRHTKQNKLAENELKEQQSIAERMDGIEIEIKAKANEQGVLYAAVGADIIAQALVKRGYGVAAKQIVAKALKTVGSHSVRVRFSHGLEVTITVTVVSTSPR